MIRYTTPVIPILVEGVDLHAFDKIRVTFFQAGTRVTKEDPTIEEDTLLVELTQKEAGMFLPGFPAYAMVNAWKDGKRKASNVMIFDIQENLLPEVIEE